MVTAVYHNVFNVATSRKIASRKIAFVTVILILNGVIEFNL